MVKGHFLEVEVVEVEQAETLPQLVSVVLEVLVEKVALKFFSIDKKNAPASSLTLTLLLLPKASRS